MSHDELSFYVDASTISGVGVFAARDLPDGQALRLFGDDHDGYLVERAEHEIPPRFRTYCLARADNIWLTPRDFGRMEVGWYLNHSAEPNVRVDGVRYFAARAIRSGEELTIDYARLDEPADKRESFVGDPVTVR